MIIRQTFLTKYKANFRRQTFLPQITQKHFYQCSFMMNLKLHLFLLFCSFARCFLFLHCRKKRSGSSAGRCTRSRSMSTLGTGIHIPYHVSGHWQHWLFNFLRPQIPDVLCLTVLQKLLCQYKLGTVYLCISWRDRLKVTFEGTPPLIPKSQNKGIELIICVISYSIR